MEDGDGGRLWRVKRQVADGQLFEAVPAMPVAADKAKPKAEAKEGPRRMPTPRLLDAYGAGGGGARLLALRAGAEDGDHLRDRGLGRRARVGAAPLQEARQPAQRHLRRRPQEEDVHAVPAGGPPLLREDGLGGGLHRRHDQTRAEGQQHLQGHR